MGAQVKRDCQPSCRTGTSGSAMVAAMPKPSSSRRRAHGVYLAAALLAVALVLGSLRRWDAGFVQGSKAPASHLSAARNGAPQGQLRTVVEALPWETDTLPPLPAGPKEMVEQAANAVMRAYRDGYPRQSVRLRIDDQYDNTLFLRQGMWAIVNGTRELVADFTTALWGGGSLIEVKDDFWGEEGTIVYYREAENSLQDCAVVHLPTRELMTSYQMDTFTDNMKERLVVLTNSEDSAASFRVDAGGRDFFAEFDKEKGLKVCEDFNQTSYFYYESFVENWKILYHRAYPFPWQVYLEDMNYLTVNIGEMDTRPDYTDVSRMVEKYEQGGGGASLPDRLQKIVRDSSLEDEKTE